MNLFTSMLFYLLFNLAYTEDYVQEFQANVNILKEYSISKNKKFRSYELLGTFTDELGNFGKLDVIITSDVENNKLIKLEATGKNTYSNEEYLYFRAYRKESDFDVGVAIAEITGASDKFKPLIGMKCVQSVKYFKDTIFGIQKCKAKKSQINILKNKSN